MAELTQFLTHHWKHYGFDFKEFFQQRMEAQNLCKHNLWGPLQFLLGRHITQGHLSSSPHSVIKVWDEEEQMQDNKGSLQGWKQIKHNSLCLKKNWKCLDRRQTALVSDVFISIRWSLELQGKDCGLLLLQKLSTPYSLRDSGILYPACDIYVQ